MRLTLSQLRKQTSNVHKWSSLSMRNASHGTPTPQKKRRRKRKTKKTRFFWGVQRKKGGAGQEINCALVRCHPGWSALAATLAAKAMKNICQCGWQRGNKNCFPALQGILKRWSHLYLGRKIFNYLFLPSFFFFFFKQVCWYLTSSLNPHYVYQY